jgi:tetratricopeptide (TPR) repeat protein
MLENHEPVTWAEELIETARAVDHPRLASLYVVAALSWIAGRVDDAFTYVDAGMAMRTAPGEVPFGFDGLLGGLYTLVGQPEKAVDWFQSHMDPVRDPLATIRANRVLVLSMVGYAEEAMVEAADIVKAAETTGNPYALTYALLAYGYAFRGTDTEAALAAMRRGLTIAHESGNRTNESFLALNVGHLEARLGDTAMALERLTRAIRIYHDSGSTTSVRSPLAVLAALLDQFGHHESAATIAGFAHSPLTAVAFPELTTAITHLRDVLGDETYESLARIGEAMTIAAIATYAYDQIDQARKELEQTP